MPQHWRMSGTEVSAVVGQQACTRFGRTWDVSHTPALFFEAGLVAGGVDLRDLAATGSANHEDANHPFAIQAGEVASRTPLFGLALRIGAQLNRWLYVGGHGDFAMGSVSGDTLRFGMLSETPSSIARMSLGAFGGARTALGPLTLRAELLVGFHAVVISTQSEYGACRGGAAASELRPRIEPRVAVETTLSPWLSAGVVGGTNALAPLDWTASVYLRWSLRAYDGAAAP